MVSGRARSRASSSHRWRDLGEFIREQRNLGQLSLRKLSEKADVSNPYLSQIERGLREPSAEILRQIARALEISSEELYVRAGILDERDDQPDVSGRDPAGPAPHRGPEEEPDLSLRHVPPGERRRRGRGTPSSPSRESAVDRRRCPAS